MAAKIRPIVPSRAKAVCQTRLWTTVPVKDLKATNVALSKPERSGFLIDENTDLPFPKITLTVTRATPASQQELDRVGADPAYHCANAKLQTASGTDPTINWV